MATPARTPFKSDNPTVVASFSQGILFWAALDLDDEPLLDAFVSDIVFSYRFNVTKKQKSLFLMYLYQQNQILMIL
jgi:hypothetical protein